MHYYGSEYMENTHYALWLFITVMTITVVSVWTNGLYDDWYIYFSRPTCSLINFARPFQILLL